MNLKTLANKLDSELGELKIVFTDPTNGKQLRVSCRNVKLMAENYFAAMAAFKSSLDVEYFCENLEYSDKNP